MIHICSKNKKKNREILIKNSQKVNKNKSVKLHKIKKNK